MNDKLKLIFQLGVDRFNRVAQANGPFYSSLRNLVLDSVDELVRRPSMEWRQPLMSTAGHAATLAGVKFELPRGGVAGYLPVAPSTGGVGQPIILHVPPWTAGIGVDSGARPFLSIFLTDQTKYNVMVVESGLEDATSSPTTLAQAMGAFHGRRVQIVNWQGAVFIALGVTIPPTSGAATAVGTGLVRVGSYKDGTGATKLNVVTGIGLDFTGSGGIVDVPDTIRDACTPKVIGLSAQKSRVIFGNFPPDSKGQPRCAQVFWGDSPGSSTVGYNPITVPSVVAGIAGYDAPVVSTGGLDPLTSGRALTIGDAAEELVATRELAIPQLKAQGTSATLFLKDHSIWLQTGEPLQSDDLGDPYANIDIAKQPVADGCASAETIAETPWGLIWAGHDDIYFMPNSGGPVVPIGRRIAKQLKNTPFDAKWSWHAAYYDGWYRLAILAPGQSTEFPFACEEQWWLDCRMGPPADWTQARWFGPQVYAPIIHPAYKSWDGAANAPYAAESLKGTFAMAVEERAGFKPELLSLQLGWLPMAYGTSGTTGHSTPGGELGLVACNLEGTTPRDWACPVGGPDEWISNAGFAENFKMLASPKIGPTALLSSDVQFMHSRQFRVLAASAPNSTEPVWTDTGKQVVDSVPIAWRDRGSFADPSTHTDDVTFDGSDAFPAQRGNEVLAYLRSMELDLGNPEYAKQFRGVNLAVGLGESSYFKVHTYREQLAASVHAEARERYGNFVLGQSVLGTGALQDAVTGISLMTDVEADQPVGSHVSFGLAEQPAIVVPAAAMTFAAKLGASGVAPTHTYGCTLRTNIFTNLATLLDEVIYALSHPSYVPIVLDSTGFTHNISDDLTGWHLPVIKSGAAISWLPEFSEVILANDPTNLGSSALWYMLGFKSYWTGLETNIGAVHATFVPWWRNIGALRIASLTGILRQFRRSPT